MPNPCHLSRDTARLLKGPAKPVTRAIKPAYAPWLSGMSVHQSTVCCKSFGLPCLPRSTSSPPLKQDTLTHTSADHGSSAVPAEQGQVPVGCDLRGALQGQEAAERALHLFPRPRGPSRGQGADPGLVQAPRARDLCQGALLRVQEPGFWGPLVLVCAAHGEIGHCSLSVSVSPEAKVLVRAPEQALCQGELPV